MSSFARALLATALSGAATRADAAAFNLSPTRVELSASAPSVLVELTNTGTSELRYQIVPYAWRQEGDAPVILDPTDALVVYPTLLTLAPGESRKLRVGTTRPPPSVEETYRIVVEELPPLDVGSPGTGVSLLTRLSVPVFVAPTGPRAHLLLGAAADPSGGPAVQVENDGNHTLRVHELRVEGIAADGRTAWSEAAVGWYLLPGARWRVPVAAPPAECDALTAVRIEAATDAGSWSALLPPAGGPCPG